MIYQNSKMNRRGVFAEISESNLSSSVSVMLIIRGEGAPCLPSHQYEGFLSLRDGSPVRFTGLGDQRSFESVRLMVDDVLSRYSVEITEALREFKKQRGDS